jgi:hypothetical protein
MNDRKATLGGAFTACFEVIISLAAAGVEFSLALLGCARTVRNYADWAEAESGQFKDEAEQERAVRLASMQKQLKVVTKQA